MKPLNISNEMKTASRYKVEVVDGMEEFSDDGRENDKRTDTLSSDLCAA